MINISYGLVGQWWHGTPNGMGSVGRGHCSRGCVPQTSARTWWNVKLLLDVIRWGRRRVDPREGMTAPWHVSRGRGFFLWLWTWQFRRTSRPGLPFPLVELHFCFSVVQKRQPCLYSQCISPGSGLDNPEGRRNLLFLSFGRGFLLGSGFRQTLLLLGFTLFKFFENCVANQEIIPTCLVEDIERLEVDDLSRG